MALISKSEGGSGFEPVPVGTYVARCVTVVDLGFQETPWGSKEKVYIGFEVPSVRVKWTKDDQDHEGPAIIGSVYTNSIHPDSNLGKALVNWRGRPFTEDEKKGFDLFTILDVPCMISVTHNTKGEKTYANIGAIMGVMKGTEVPARETDILAYSPQDESKKDSFERMPQWLKDKCMAGHRMDDNPEHYPQGEPPPGDPEWDDDIPF